MKKSFKEIQKDFESKVGSELKSLLKGAKDGYTPDAEEIVDDLAHDVAGQQKLTPAEARRLRRKLLKKSQW
jgi:hypothetical protein